MNTWDLLWRKNSRIKMQLSTMKMPGNMGTKIIQLLVGYDYQTLLINLLVYRTYTENFV